MLVAGISLAIGSYNCCTRVLTHNELSKMLVTSKSQAICSQQKLLKGIFLSTSVPRKQVACYKLFVSNCVMHTLKKTHNFKQATQEHKRATWEYCHKCYVQ